MKEYEEFLELLEKEDKENAVKYALNLVEKGKVSIVDLYIKILTPALNNMQCKLTDKKMCIWKEHVRTAIVRTIVECCYPYVIKSVDEKNKKNKTAVVICPPEENHDLGARMVADYFTLCGWKAIFVGSNTPYEDFFNASETIHPNIIAISISNYYTIVAAKKIIADLKALLGSSVKIIVGGYAVRNNKENFEALGADYHIETFDDLKQLPEMDGDNK